MDWSTAFEGALPYAELLDRYAKPAQRARWDASHAWSRPTAEQVALLGGFGRRMPVLCLAGTWCGDCSNQCPSFEHFAGLAPGVELRFLDRDEAPAWVRDELKINGGNRVPALAFLSEDFDVVARFGDRTLAAYRRLAADQLGAACPTGFVPPDAELAAAVAAEWLDQFERAQLILRLSPRLRERYND